MRLPERSVVRRHHLLSFVILTYALTWIFTIPFVYVWRVVYGQQFAPWMAVFAMGPFGPSVAAIILTRLLDGPGSVRPLLRTLIAWRAPPGWYVYVVFGPIALVAVAVLLSSFRGEALAAFAPAGLAIAPVALLAALPFGPLPEELGWRGWLLPRLLTRHGTLVSGLIVGVVWTFWHTPMFWFPGAAIPSFLDLGPAAVGLYLLQVCAESVIFTVIWIRTRGSVFVAIVHHTTFNTAETILFRALPDPSPRQDLEIYLLTIALAWLLALVFLAFFAQPGASGKPS